MKNNVLIHLTSGITYPISTLIIQIFGLLVLTSQDFGVFSALFLVTALGNSLAYSLVCEPWQRNKLNKENWAEFSSIALVVSIFPFLFALVLGAFLKFDLLSLMLVSFASMFTVIRFQARYFQVNQSLTWRALTPDLAGIIFSVVLFSVQSQLHLANELQSIFWLWFCNSGISALGNNFRKFHLFNTTKNWFLKYHHEIKFLFADSTLLDLGGIATPYVLIPILGISNFGTYRGVTNIASPVKIIFSGLRPYSSKVNSRFFVTFKGILLALAITLFFGIIIYFSLQLISGLIWAESALETVISYSLITSLYFSATFLNGIYYILSRSLLPAKQLVKARIPSTVLAVVFPLIGGVLFGLEGALWGLVLATSGMSALWFFQIHFNFKT